jgi:hypothetical protein
MLFAVSTRTTGFSWADCDKAAGTNGDSPDVARALIRASHLPERGERCLAGKPSSAPIANAFGTAEVYITPCWNR